MNIKLPKDSVYWHTKKEPRIERLKEDIKADVAIVGGGVTGLSAAQAFLKKGLKVVLLEKNFCGSGASGKSSGFITPDSEFGLSEFIKRFGKTGAKKLWDFGNFGVDFIRKNIIKNKIKCDYLIQDALFVANNKKSTKSIEEEYKARKVLGYKTKIYYKTPVNKISNNILQTANGFKINANKTIVCTDRFIPQLKDNDKDVYHVQTYLMVSSPLSNAEMKKIFPEKQIMVWDSDLNYKYFRPIGGNRLLMGGGDIVSLYYWNEIHNNAKICRKLSSYFKKKFPSIKIKWEYMWPGMLGISKDFLPIVAQDSKMTNVFYAGAAAGLPWCAAIANYIRDKITDNRSDLDRYLFPSRKFPPVSLLQPVLRKMTTFALSHGYVKFMG